MDKQMILKFWRESRDYLFITLGVICYSLGWTCFLLPYQITTGAARHRRRCGHIPPRRVRVYGASRAVGGVAGCTEGQLRHRGSDRGAFMDEAQHQSLRRRPRQDNDRGTVGWRGQRSVHTDVAEVGGTRRGRDNTERGERRFCRHGTVVSARGVTRACGTRRRRLL